MTVVTFKDVTGVVRTINVSDVLAGPLVAKPRFGAFVGAGSQGGRSALATYEAWLGRPVDYVLDYADQTSWSQMTTYNDVTLAPWVGVNRQLVYAVPLTVAGTTLAQVAAGSNDAAFTAIGNALVKFGFPDAVVRIGWEQNLDTYAWNVKANGAPNFAAAWRRVVGLLRACPGAKFKFHFNPSNGIQSGSPSASYPGDDVVDYIGGDVYNQAWHPETLGDVRLRWQREIYGADSETWINDSIPCGMLWTASFAKKHNKPVWFGEWGTGKRPNDNNGGGDDPHFIAQMFAFFNNPNNRVFGHNYFEFSDPTFMDTRLMSGQYPLASAVFLRALA